MDYFALSPFCDTNSNNKILRTQRKYENPNYGHAEEKLYVPSLHSRQDAPYSNPLMLMAKGSYSELNAFRSGFEYVAAHAQPPDLFLIHRRDVQTDGSRANVTAVYFILEGKIYPTPTLYDVMATRLVSCPFIPPCMSLL